MITQFKIFESEKQFREIDLQLLWDDITRNYYSKLFDKPVHLDMYFNSVLKKLLLNKEIEFKRAVHPYDGAIIYGLSGMVEYVELKNDSHNYLIRPIIILLDNGKNKDKYEIGNISCNYNFDRKPLIVKIYDSEELPIEKEINLLKDTNKYNL